MHAQFLSHFTESQAYGNVNAFLFLETSEVQGPCPFIVISVTSVQWQESLAVESRVIESTLCFKTLSLILGNISLCEKYTGLSHEILESCKKFEY